MCTGFVHGFVVASAQVSLVITSRPEQGESVCVDSLVPGGGVVAFDAQIHIKYISSERNLLNTTLYSHSNVGYCSFPDLITVYRGK